MCNILLADEINRTSPKTQAALLEVMEERKVTVDHITRELPKPFIVIATQNPVGSAGTSMLPESQLDRFMVCMSMGYPDMEYELEIVKGKFIVIATQNPVGSAGTSMLPESQLDRFMVCMSMGYPDMEYELEIVKGKVSANPLEQVEPVLNGQQLLAMQKQVSGIFIHDAIYRYIGKLVSATRNHSMIELGISPRGTIALAKMVQSLAYLRGRTYALPDDVSDVFLDVEAHRIRMNAKARVNHVMAQDVLRNILEGTPKPSVVKKQS